jgi:hypothetical protein
MMKNFLVHYNLCNVHEGRKRKQGVVYVEKKEDIKKFLYKRYNPTGWNKYKIEILSIKELKQNKSRFNLPTRMYLDESLYPFWLPQYKGIHTYINRPIFTDENKKIYIGIQEELRDGEWYVWCYCKESPLKKLFHETELEFTNKFE